VERELEMEMEEASMIDRVFVCDNNGIGNLAVGIESGNKMGNLEKPS
jgi:hypothetical protein